MSKEGDGIASPKRQLAWAVEINGHISYSEIFCNRRNARWVRNSIATDLSEKDKVHVRRVIITPTKGR